LILKFLTPLLLLLSTPAQETLEDGFYLTVDCALRNENKRKNTLDDRQTVCLSQHPVMTVHEIEGVSSVVDAGLTSYFDIAISAKAVNQFNTLRAALKSATFALVIDNQVLLLVGPDDRIERTLRIVVYTQTRDLQRARDKIADLVAKRGQ